LPQEHLPPGFIAGKRGQAARISQRQPLPFPTAYIFYAHSALQIMDSEFHERPKLRVSYKARHRPGAFAGSEIINYYSISIGKRNNKRVFVFIDVYPPRKISGCELCKKNSVLRIKRGWCLKRRGMICV
jgi:hypothetical protein